jgi:hypothetical protein
MMNRDEVRRKLIKFAENSDKSVSDLRRQWLGEMYELGCLTHEKYCLMMSWIEAEEGVQTLDLQIVDYHDSMDLDKVIDSQRINEI